MNLFAQDTPKDKSFEVYGFAMMDAGYNFNQIQPDWYDVVRPTKLPSYDNEFGTDGNMFFGVRQSRLGVKSWTPTSMGELKTQFEFELFGTGVDAGQTTIRLRHAYGQLGSVGAGQTWSPFMDIDVFPNSVEYWGPNGMAFFRNVQVRWMPDVGGDQMTIALERPGASADLGNYADRIELQNVKARFPVPDLSAEYRANTGFGYIEGAGILRYMKWEDISSTPNSALNGDAIGWGVNLSSNINIDKDVIRLSVVYGAGVQNYMNDAPVDVAIESPVDSGGVAKGVALPMLGIVAFYEHSWGEKFASTVGYSMLQIDNTDGQTASAFKKGQYALGNLIYYPAKDVMIVGEVQWGNRENLGSTLVEGYKSDILKVQFSFKYNFSQPFYRN
jgi:hypothetical protein